MKRVGYDCKLWAGQVLRLLSWGSDCWRLLGGETEQGAVRSSRSGSLWRGAAFSNKCHPIKKIYQLDIIEEQP
jgi:hypothetical protein